MIIISVNGFDIKVISYIQEKGIIRLSDSEELFSKSISSVKRTLQNINSYLPSDKQIIIDENIVYSKLNYSDYLNFINLISITDYISNKEERINLMIVYAFFNQSLNMSRLYNQIGVSITTKKKDSKALSDFLELHKLHSEILPKKGIVIMGEENRYRVLIATILSRLIEINSYEQLVPRRANNPFEKMIADYFIAKAYEEIEEAKCMLNELSKENYIHISYSSRKLLYVYLAIAIYRSKRQYFIELKSIPLKVKNINLFSNENENLFLNNLISSLDATNMTLQQDSVLNNLIANFIDNVQSQIITHIKDDPKVFQEVYDYIYKCIIRNNYDFYFYDNKLDDLRKHYEKLYRILSVSLIDIEEHYNIIFSYFQIATLTLIIRKFTMQHKVIGRNSKNIVIVTNSSVEKINFFIETMKFYVDIANITIININEIHLLENLKYDCILTFSNRIQTLLKENNYTSTKLNFYITKEDIETLFSLGFSTSRRKIKITAFINKIRNKNEEEIKNILLNDYNNYFV